MAQIKQFPEQQPLAGPVPVGLTGVVSRQAIEKAVTTRAPRGTEEMNRKALEAGFEAASGWRSMVGR